MKTVKKITVFYTDGTFDDFDKQNTLDIGKVAPYQPTPSYQWNTPPTSWGGPQSISTLTTTYIPALTPQSLGSATILSTQGIQALTSAQISSLTVSAAGPLYDDAGYRGGYTTKSFY